MSKDYLKKFVNYDVDDFDEFHKKAYPNANIRTHNNFKQALKRLEKIYGEPLEDMNLKFLNDPKSLFQKLEASDYSHNTNITTFSQILKLLKIVDFPLNEYNKFQTILNVNMKQNTEKREEELKEKLGYLPTLDTLKEILKQKIDEIDDKTTFAEMKSLILLGILILSVPLKLIQYSKMLIVFGEPESNYINNFLLEDVNGEYFIKSKDISVKLVDKHLIKLIQIWINEYNVTKHFFINNENSKSGMNNKDLRFALATATEEYFDANITNQEIRQIYMKHLMSLDPDFKQKFALSHILGYKDTNVLELHS